MTVSGGARLPPISILAEDTYGVDLSPYFNKSRIDGEYLVEWKYGVVIDQYNPMYQLELEQDYKNVSLIQRVAEGVFVVVSKDSTLRVLKTSKGLSTLVSETTINLPQSKEGSSIPVKCTGFQVDTSNDILYIGCSSISQDEDQSLIYLISYSLLNDSVLHIETILQKDSIRVVNIPQILLYQDYIFFYDQGSVQQKESADNSRVAVFSVNIPEVISKFNKVIRIGNTKQFTNLHDLYIYQDKVLATVRMTTDSKNITIAQCSRLNIEGGTLGCFVFKSTDIQFGKVVIDRNILYKLDLADKSLTQIKLLGPFQSSRWTKNFVSQQSNLMVNQTIDQVYVRSIQGSSKGAVIFYSDASSGTDIATGKVSWATFLQTYTENQFLTEYNGHWVEILGSESTSYLLRIYKICLLYYRVKGTDFPRNKNLDLVVRVGKDEVTMTVAIPAYSMDSVHNKLEIENRIGTVDLYDSSEHYLNLNYSHVITGNLIDSFEIELTLNNSGVTPFIEHDALLSINFQVFHIDVAQTWYKKTMAVQLQKMKKENTDDTWSLYHSSCRHLGSNKIYCDQKLSVEIPKVYQFLDKIHVTRTNRSIIMGINLMQDISTLFILGSDGDDVKLITVQGSKNNFAVYEPENQGEVGHFYLILSNGGSIYVHKITNDLKYSYLLLKLDGAELGSDALCLTDIAVPSKDKMVVDLLSTCLGRKQLLRVDLKEEKVIASIKLKEDLENPRLCSFKEEVIVVSDDHIRSFPLDYLGTESLIPFDQLKMDVVANEFGVFCLPDQQKFIVKGTDSQTKEPKLVEILGDQFLRQNKRYLSNFDLRKGKPLRILEFFGSVVIEVKEISGKVVYYKKREFPVLGLRRSSQSIKHKTLTAQITVGNGVNTETFLQSLNLRSE